LAPESQSFLGNIVAGLRHSRAWKSSLSGAALHVCTHPRKSLRRLLFAQSARNPWAISKDLTNSDLKCGGSNPAAPASQSGLLQRLGFLAYFLLVKIAGSALRSLDHLWVGSTKASWAAQSARDRGNSCIDGELSSDPQQLKWSNRCSSSGGRFANRSSSCIVACWPSSGMMRCAGA
jgi:hypothetical protein